MVFRRVLLLLFLATTVANAQGPRWVREFPETVNVVVVQNPIGWTQVEVAAANTVRAIAEPAAGGPWDESAIRLDQSAPGVLILRVMDFSPMNLQVTIPARAVLSVQSNGGKISIRGAAARVMAESKSGHIVLQLPPNFPADYVLKSVTGQVLANVPRAENPALAGVSGRPLVQAISESGNVEVVPWDDAPPTTAAPASAPPRAATPVIGNPRTLSASERIQALREQIMARTASSRSSEPKSLANWRAGNKSSAGSQPADGRVRVNSDLVLLNAYVVNPANASISNLVKDDFKLTDNGKDQSIAIFEPVHRPLDLLLLLDLSGSTHSKFDVVKKAVKKFVDTMSPEDRIAIAAFTSRFMVISEFTSDRKLLKKRMDDTKNRRGGTEFYLSLWNAMDMMAEVDNPRRAIVVMTDGVDNSLQPSVGRDPTVKFEELLERARLEGTSIYTVYLNTEYEMVVKEGSGDSLSYKEAREQLQALTEATGTTMFRADRFEDLEGAYERVASELRNLYTLGFYPTERGADGNWHDLKVTVQRADATVRARKGYFVR